MAVGRANAVILFRPEAYQVGQQVKGRQAAGSSFLKGFVRSAGIDRYFVTAPTVDEGRQFASLVQGITGQSIDAAYVPYSAIFKAEEVGTVYQPDPLLAELAWWRRRFGQRLFSLCGVAHTTATQAVMRGLTELVTGPVQPWDAVICPSAAVKSMITTVLDAYTGYLVDRFGAKRANVRVPIQLPVIPLGVNADEFAPTERRKQARNTLRRQLGIADGDIAALFMGRLDPAGKIDPEITYRVMERAAQQTGKKLHLIWCGWFKTEADRKAFDTGAQRLRGKVGVSILDGQQPQLREFVWRAADVFLGLVDNIQETFGIAPLEAMAAGLPAIVTDWDGFKETVEDGKQGYRIRTLMPPAGAGNRIAWRFESFQIDYPQYLSAVSQSLHVDVAQAADALVRLAEDETLRAKMGQAGIRRVKDHFEWSKIVPQYQALWADLGERRRAGDEKAPGTSVPRALDPFELFGGYPTGTIPETAALGGAGVGVWPPGLGMGDAPAREDGETVRDALARIEEADRKWLWVGRRARAKDRLEE